VPTTTADPGRQRSRYLNLVCRLVSRNNSPTHPSLHPSPLVIHLSHPAHRVIAPSSTRAASTALDRTAYRSRRLPRFIDQSTAAPFPALAVSRARRSLRGLQAPLCRFQHSIAPPFRTRLICVQSSSVALRPQLCALACGLLSPARTCTIESAGLYCQPPVGCCVPRARRHTILLAARTLSAVSLRLSVSGVRAPAGPSI
jgi:hypothetical protein